MDDIAITDSIYNLCSKDKEIIKRRASATEKGKCEEAIKKIREVLGEAINCDGPTGCCGLSANTIGIDTRACLVVPKKGTEYEFYNPEIVKWSNPAYNQERCYCLLPKDSFIIKRYNKITVKDDKNGMTELSGIDAFAAQHLIDHLNGKIVCDRGINTEEFMKRAIRKHKESRNAMCSCGSDKKYKRCCGRKKCQPTNSNAKSVEKQPKLSADI